MDFTWEQAFSKCQNPNLRKRFNLSGIIELKDYLDRVHIKHCLLKPYFETPNYPLVEARELLPSFEIDLYEYKELPGFSLVALNRKLNYFDEVFQYDILHSASAYVHKKTYKCCPLEYNIFSQNIQTFLSRLTRHSHDDFRQTNMKQDITRMEVYPSLLKFLLQMERAHILSHDSQGHFHLSGVYSSLPSNLDSQLKKFGLKIGKFSPSNEHLYERNRNFVYQFMMELYGFPIVSERRTSAALFAARLFKQNEDFLVRVQGQSDRTITTLYAHPEARHYPRLEKMALVEVDEQQKDAISALEQGGFFVDRQKRVVILRVHYRQHKYNQNNLRQDRALSAVRQEIVHPLTGEVLVGPNIIKDTYNMLLRLNDIVRGEYLGRITYKRGEIVENTESHEKRLKFLHAWLGKHQRRIISYSDEFYARLVKILDNYLLNPHNFEVFDVQRSLHQEVWSRYSYIQQARKVRDLEDLQYRRYKGVQVSHHAVLLNFTEILNDLKFEMATYFDPLIEKVLVMGERVLNDSYLNRKYVNKKDEDLSNYGLSIKKLYGRLVFLLDEFKSIRKSRKDKLAVLPPDEEL